MSLGTYFIERRTGPTITLDEAEELVKSYGPLETRGVLTADEREKLRIENDGALVKFVTYDEGKSAFDVSSTFTVSDQGIPLNLAGIPHQRDV